MLLLCWYLSSIVTKMFSQHYCRYVKVSILRGHERLMLQLLDCSYTEQDGEAFDVVNGVMGNYIVYQFAS